MHILLVQPNPTPRFSPFQKTNSLEILAADLPDSDRVDCLDLSEFPGRLEDTLQSNQPDLVGIQGLVASDTAYVLDIAESVKRDFPQVFLFVWGNHAGLCPSDFYHPAVNAIILSDERSTIPLLASAYPYELMLMAIPNLVINRSVGQCFSHEPGPIHPMQWALHRAYGWAYKMTKHGRLSASG